MDWHDAADAGDLSRLQQFFREGNINPDKIDVRGNTALFNASFRGHFSIVQYLLEQNVDKNMANHYGTTPLLIATCHGHLEVTRCLLEQGADKNKAAVNDGMTPLHMAAQLGHLEIAMLLMSYGADLNARNRGGRLPIDVAINEEIKEVIRDEPRRRMDHGHKRATEQDQYLDVTTSITLQQVEGEEEPSHKNPRIDEGIMTEEEAKILAEINEDSEPSDNEDDH